MVKVQFLFSVHCADQIHRKFAAMLERFYFVKMRVYDSALPLLLKYRCHQLYQQHQLRRELPAERIRDYLHANDTPIWSRKLSVLFKSKQPAKNLVIEAHAHAGLKQAVAQQHDQIPPQASQRKEKQIRRANFNTRDARKKRLLLIAKQLTESGYKIAHIQQLKMKHVKYLVKHWLQQGLSAGTIKNCMTDLRWVMDKYGNADLIPTKNDSLNISQRLYDTNNGGGRYGCHLARKLNC